LNRANRATEATLAALAPALGAVDPVAAGFAAGFAAGKRVGNAAVRRRLFAWRAAAAVGLVGMGLSWILPLSTPSPSPSPSSHEVRLAQHGPSQPMVASVDAAVTPVLPAQSILAMQQAVANQGLAGLSAPQPPASPPRNLRDADLF
jgi:hypothetical protein